MYENAHRPGVAARELAADLGLDRGYLSRILKRFAAKRLVRTLLSPLDATRRHSFGHDLVRETWELSLAADASMPAVPAEHCARCSRSAPALRLIE